MKKIEQLLLDLPGLSLREQPDWGKLLIQLEVTS